MAVSPSPSPSPSVAPEDAVKWGDNSVEAGVENVTWRRWQTSAGIEVQVSGDPDWGDALAVDGIPIYSPVEDTGDTDSKTFTVQLGSGAPTIYIRGGASPFAMFDSSPSWQEYTAPVGAVWRYVQVRLGGITIPIEGYGKNVAAYDWSGVTVRTVTDSARTNTPGTLTYILSNYHSDMVIRFAADIDTGRIATDTPAYIQGSNVFIDGFANGHTNGVTIDCTERYVHQALAVYGNGGNIWIRGLNFRGNWDLGVAPSYDCTQDDLVRLDASRQGDVTDGLLDGVLIERCTFYNSSDGGLDVTSNGPGRSVVKNLTIQQCLFTDCGGCQLIKYGGLERGSIHHNVYVHNGERNPEIKGNQGLINYENNIIFQNLTNASYPANYRIEHWDTSDTNPFGIKLWCSTLDYPVANGNPVVNVRGNAFLGDKAGTAIQVDSGASDAGIYFGLQGTTSAHNYWSACTPLDSSPKADPTATDSGYEVTLHSIAGLKDLLSQIGCPLRLDTDQTRLDDIANYYPI